MIAALRFEGHAVPESGRERCRVHAGGHDDGVGCDRRAGCANAGDAPGDDVERDGRRLDEPCAAFAQARGEGARQSQRVRTMALLGQHDQVREPRRE